MMNEQVWVHFEGICNKIYDHLPGVSEKSSEVVTKCFGLVFALQQGEKNHIRPSPLNVIIDRQTFNLQETGAYFSPSPRSPHPHPTHTHTKYQRASILLYHLLAALRSVPYPQ